MAFRPIRGYSDATRYPSTEHQLRHIFRASDSNGLADAFRRVGNRVLFDPERLQDLLARQGGAGRAATQPKQAA